MTPSRSGAVTVALASQRRVQAERAVVSAQHPAAAEAGVEVFQAGGNAVDAAVAAVFAATVADVGRTGIGGYGGHLVYHEAATGTTWLVDFPTRAPLATTADTPIQTEGPLAVAVPAVVAGLAAAHARFGSLPWAELLAPAIRLARDGIHFPSPGRDQLFHESVRFRQFTETMRVFVQAWDDHQLRQPDLAATLETLARDGAKTLYHGALGAEIVRYLRAEGGLLAGDDLAAYEAAIRSAHRSTYRGLDVFTPGPHSGGGVLVPLLQLLERCELGAMEPLGAERMGTLVGATERVWRERLGAKPSGEAGCTDHLVAADARGNVVSVTTTLQMLMGSGVTVPGTGIVLNNGMGLFEAAPGRPASIGAGKRAITNMCPTVVLHHARPMLAIGASGGRRIPSMVTQAATLMIDHGWPGDQALAAPRYHHTVDDPLLVEEGFLRTTLDALEEQGYHVSVRPWAGTDLGGQAPALWFDTDGRLFGAPDPRRHGGAAAW